MLRAGFLILAHDADEAIADKFSVLSNLYLQEKNLYTGLSINYSDTPSSPFIID